MKFYLLNFILILLVACDFQWSKITTQKAIKEIRMKEFIDKCGINKATKY